jgi:hypothetical protein
MRQFLSGGVTCLALIFASVGLAAPARADTIVLTDNFSGNGSHLFVPSSLNWAGVELHTSGTDATFSSMTAYLEGGLAAGNVTGGIFSDASAAPGTEVASFNTYLIAQNSAIQSYEFTTTYTLSANTSYWFVLSGPAIPSPKWAGDNAALVASTGYSSSGFKITTNSGVNWSTAPSTYGVVINISSATAAPLPRSLFGGVTLLGLLSGGTWLRRRRGAQSGIIPSEN